MTGVLVGVQIDKADAPAREDGAVERQLLLVPGLVRRALLPRDVLLVLVVAVPHLEETVVLHDPRGIEADVPELRPVLGQLLDVLAARPAVVHLEGSVLDPLRRRPEDLHAKTTVVAPPHHRFEAVDPAIQVELLPAYRCERGEPIGHRDPREGGELRRKPHRSSWFKRVEQEHPLFPRLTPGAGRGSRGSFRSPCSPVHRGTGDCLVP